MEIIQLFDASEVPRQETTFERANRIAEERKAAAWAAYTPLPRAAFIDDWARRSVLIVNDLKPDECCQPETVTIPAYGDTGQKATFGGPQMRAAHAVLARPTELSATAAAYAGHWIDDLIVIRMAKDNSSKRKCCLCNKEVPVIQFAKDKRNWTGLAWYCAECRKHKRIGQAA